MAAADHNTIRWEFVFNTEFGRSNLANFKPIKQTKENETTSILLKKHKPFWALASNKN